ncbi:AsnC family protein [Prescottella equi]|uniref:AsnC family protein n=1 Tax=Rhodococcus hoagii TaxID=43767 RepID=UPI00384AFA0F
MTERGDHEGWVAAVAPDGRGSVGSMQGHVVLPGGERIADNLVVGWRAQCECGWAGPLWTRVTDAEAADEREHRVFDTEGGDPPVEVEDLIHPEWKAHVAPVEALAAVAAAATEARKARLRLDTVVAEARAVGASWADIGRAAEISRQSAHERWG